MEDLKDTLRENQEFMRDQERTISARLAVLPKGHIRTKKIGSETYYYLSYRKGRSVKTDYLGKGIDPRLRDALEERKRLEKEWGRIREGLKLLRSPRNKETDLTEPLRDILRKMTEEKMWEAGLEIIGNWCFLLYQKHLPMEKYPLKTDDLDILVPRPFKGRAFDFASFLGHLGFSQHFHPDGSHYFSGMGMKVEFLIKEGRRRMEALRSFKEMAITPQELRYLEILFADPIELKVARGIKAKVPAPAAFLLHKLIISTLFERRKKKEKDIRQAIYTASYALTDRTETARLRRLGSILPRKWRARIGRALRDAQSIVPLEQGVILRLKDMLAGDTLQSEKLKSL